MRTFTKAFGVAISVVTLSGAYAATNVLVSAPIANEAGGISCVITNAGPKRVTVSAVEIVGAIEANSLLPTPTELAPGQFLGTLANNESWGYCRFTIDKSPKNVRAAACRFQAGKGPGTALNCLEAR